ncbi:MAG: GNAT family N-acetyltransferase [Bryobacteraceae bacterium]
MASTRDHADIRDISAVSIASAGVAFQMFNAAFWAPPVVADPQDVERRLAAAAVHFEARQLSWSFWSCEGMVEPALRGRLRRLLERRRLDWTVDLPGMFAERILPARRELPRLEIRRVDGPQERVAFCDIGSVCFRVPIGWFREIFQWDPVWKDFHAWVGYVDGEPVVTAGAVVSEDAIGIYNVATLPLHRRRGYAEALLRSAIDTLQRETGIGRAVLQSTEDGLRIYEAMGFRTVTKVAVFASPTW